MEKTSCEAAIGDFFEGGGGTELQFLSSGAIENYYSAHLLIPKLQAVAVAKSENRKVVCSNTDGFFSRASFFSISLYLSISGVSLTRFLEEVQHYLFSIQKCMLGFAAGGEASLMCRE